jgi:4-oxalomesaconate hydratase
MSGSMLVISAHAVDYVWRAGGTIAKYVRNGWDVNVLVLSFGARGESAPLWKESGQTYEEVERVRKAESVSAAEILGCQLHFFGLRDYRLDMTDEVIDQMVRKIREFKPSIILSHGEKDPFNPDHPITHKASVDARLLAGSAGVLPELAPAPPSRFYAFEPHQTELSEFVPDIIVDITEDIEKKIDAMRCVPTQEYLVDFHIKLAESRGYHARRNSSNKGIRYAEAFQSYIPIVVDELP